MTYVLSQTNTAPTDAKPVMHLLRLDTNQDLEIPNATAPAFSADSSGSRIRSTRVAAVVAAEAGVAVAVARRPGGAAPAGQNGRAGTGAPSGAAASRRAAESGDRRRAVVAGHAVVHLRGDVEPSLLRRRAPGGAGGGAGRGGAGRCAAAEVLRVAAGAAAEPTGPRGADVILHDLVSGRDQLLGSVGDISFNKKGDLLAYTVDAAVRDGNGLFVLDLHNGRVNALDNDARVYNRLTWNDDGTGARGAQGRGRRQDARARQHPARLSERAGRARRRGVRAGQARSGEGRRDFRRAGS